jgi:hypothetical protein
LAKIGNKNSLGYKQSEEHKLKVALSKIGNTVNLGRYETEDEAALAYNKFIIENNIEGALLNDIV